MRMKRSPTSKVSKKHPPDKRPEPARPPIAPKLPRGRFEAIALALAALLTAGLVFATAAIKVNQREPKRAPCPCICAKA